MNSSPMPSTLGASPSGSVVKNLPAVQDTGVHPRIWKIAPEEGMATHSSIPAWRIPPSEEPGVGESYSPRGRRESDRTESTQHTCIHNSYPSICLLGEVTAYHTTHSIKCRELPTLTDGCQSGFLTPVLVKSSTLTQDVVQILSLG